MRASSSRSADYASLRAQLQEARWLIRSLEIRNETLLKVARSIVQRQAAFLERGDEAMHPMILRDVAEAVAMHESTISRVTTGKYMHTPRGIFEFRYFFSSHVSGADGEDVSSVAIRARIRKLIADEGAREAAERRPARRDAGGRRREGGEAHCREVPRGARPRFVERAQAHGRPRPCMNTGPAGTDSRGRDRSDERQPVTLQEDGTMQVNLSGHHVEITPPLRSYVEKKLARVLRHCDRVIDVHCTLTVEKLRHEAEATVRLAGGDRARRRRPRRHVCRHRPAGGQARRAGPPPQGKAPRPAGGATPSRNGGFALTAAPESGDNPGW